MQTTCLRTLQSRVFMNLWIKWGSGTVNTLWSITHSAPNLHASYWLFFTTKCPAVLQSCSNIWYSYSSYMDAEAVIIRVSFAAFCLLYMTTTACTNQYIMYMQLPEIWYHQLPSTNLSIFKGVLHNALHYLVILKNNLISQLACIVYEIHGVTQAHNLKVKQTS